MSVTETSCSWKDSRNTLFLFYLPICPNVRCCAQTMEHCWSKAQLIVLGAANLLPSHLLSSQSLQAQL